MKKNVSLFSIICFCLIFLAVYYRWFLPNPIIGGDWPFFYQETLGSFSLPVPSWNPLEGNGLGAVSPIYVLQQFQYVTTNISYLFHIPWVIVYKISWFGLFLIISFFSIVSLLKFILPHRPVWMYLVGGTIFITNTYILMVVGGGQMGVALAYAVSPLIFTFFLKTCDLSLSKERLSTIRSSLIAGIVLGAEMLFDPRSAYLLIISIFIYFILKLNRKILFSRYLFWSLLMTFFLPFVVAGLLHATWILPYFFAKQDFTNSLGAGGANIGIVRFLSFASFSQTFSLLHPNWPDNIFGKVYFMRPEFLIFPIIAFYALGAFKKEEKVTSLPQRKKILYFLFLIIFAAFLAKGASFPFGNIYLWLFAHVPGFILFRDSTKFYILIAISYSVVIPHSLKKISSKLVILFFIFWAFTIREAIMSQTQGTFALHGVPHEYVILKDFLNNQSEFFRILWIPNEQRFSFYSNTHPPIEASHLWNTSDNSKLINFLKEKDAKEYLQSSGVKYVIVPYDSLGEIFQKDRRYDDAAYRVLVNNVARIDWLKKQEGFGSIAVFQLDGYKSHFWATDKAVIKDRMITPDEYSLHVLTKKPATIIFVENYNPYWIIKVANKEIPSVKTKDGFNSFPLNKAGEYTVTIYFAERNIYMLGRIISALSFITVLVVLTVLRKK